MPDNLRDRSLQDRARINMNEKWEVRHWTKTLRVSEEELRRAIEKVGPLADDVRQELGRAKSTTGTKAKGAGVTSNPDF